MVDLLITTGAFSSSLTYSTLWMGFLTLLLKGHLFLPTHIGHKATDQTAISFLIFLKRYPSYLDCSITYFFSAMSAPLISGCIAMGLNLHLLSNKNEITFGQ